MAKDDKTFWVKSLSPPVKQVVDAMHPSPADPLGSWTGLPLDGEEPVRDVDDF